MLRKGGLIKNGEWQYKQGCTPNVNSELQKALSEQSKKVYINGKKWKEWDVADWIAAVVIWRVEDLDVEGNHEPKLLKNISHINFINLNRLTIWRNSIDSFQCLCLLEFPQMVTLNMDDNNVNSIRCLRKASLPNLSILQFSNNPINDGEKLAEMHTRQKFQTFSLDYRNDPFEVCRDISFLAKFKATSFKLLRAQFPKRVRQQNTYQALGRKFTETNISRYSQ